MGTHTPGFPGATASFFCMNFLSVVVVAVRSDLNEARLLALLNEACYSPFVNSLFIQHRSASYGLDRSSPASPLSSDGLHPARGSANSHHAGFDPRKRCVSHLSNAVASRARLVYSSHSESALFRPGCRLSGPCSALSVSQSSVSSQNVPRRPLCPCRSLSAPHSSGNPTPLELGSHRWWPGWCMPGEATAVFHQSLHLASLPHLPHHLPGKRSPSGLRR